MKKNRRKGSKEPRLHGSVEDHERSGKMLHPAFARLDRVRTSSWRDDRLPDQLISVLLVTRLDRTLALNILRRVAHSFQGAFEKYSQNLDLTLTGVVRMPDELAGRIIALVCSAPGAINALRPLLLFDALPGRKTWAIHLGNHDGVDSWSQLSNGIARTLSHQSQESTDARWARLLFRAATGQARMPAKQFNWVTQYPTGEDPRIVNGFIRSSEIAEFPGEDYSLRDQWAESFWQQCLKNTHCGPLMKCSLGPTAAATTSADVNNLVRALSDAAAASTKTSGRDARHGAAFGLIAYALNILVEMMRIGVAQGVLGRLGLRVVLESYVTLSHLTSKDDVALWEGFRDYGQGQAKLAMLKVDDFVDPPAFVTTQLLEELATEDKAPYFLSMNLGHWANQDLRKLSESAGCKAEYDKIYPWTSSFVHGNWAAVRSASMAVCTNPLHRMHAVIEPGGNSLGDVIADTCELIDQMLTCLEKLYGVQLPSLKLPTPQAGP